MYEPPCNSHLLLACWLYEVQCNAAWIIMIFIATSRFRLLVGAVMLCCVGWV